MESRRNLKIAMIGSKGLPAVFGGIERHVEEIGKRLASRGHLVTVFGRKPFSREGEHMGMTLRVLPSIPTKNLDTATNSLITCFKVLPQGFDILHFHGIGPSIFAWIPAMAGRKTVSTIHALDYRQQKWGRVAKFLLRAGERGAVRSTSAPVAVSKLMASGLTERYGRMVRYIPNGATLRDSPGFDGRIVPGIEKGRYILTVGRFIVERGFDTLLDAFSRVRTDMKLVIVGDERFAVDYARKIREMAGERVVFPGYVYGEDLDRLYANCAFYVLPSLVEGLPISLIEAMSFARPVIVSDIPENLEVAAGVGEQFRRGDAGDLARALEEMLAMDPARLEDMGRKARRRVEEDYDWDSITSQLESLYYEILG